MKKLNYLLVLSLSIFLNSCSGLSPTAPIVEDLKTPIVDGKPIIVSNNPVTKFNDELRAKGINLTDEENIILKNLKVVKPIGRWVASETSSAKAILENNFNEFKNTFANQPQSDTDYMVNAIKFANSANFYARYYFDTEYYAQKKKVLLIKWDPQTTEFIVIQVDGRVSNYQMTNKIGAPRYILVPDTL